MKLEDVKAHHPGAETFVFGDNQALCDALLRLVREGKKTATCGALRDYEAGDDALPCIGRRDIALAWDGSPALVIETVGLTLQTYDNVPEDFALQEGENDSLAGWRADHKRYFECNGGWRPDMVLVCERFRMVEDLS